MRTQSKYTIMSGVLLSLMVVSSLAIASNRKTYSSWSCNSTVPYPGTSYTWQPKYWYGTIYDDQTTYLRAVNCPVIKDDGLGIVSSSFQAYDRSPTEDFVCKLAGELMSGDNFWREQVQATTTGYGSAAQQVNLGAVPSVYGYYTLQCFIPRNSGNNYSHFISYDIQEG